MKRNMGKSDRVLRIVVAIILTVMYFNGIVTGIVGIVLLALAGVFVLTSLFSFCPLYAPFGIKTCKAEGAD